MLLVDANLLIYAVNSDAPLHAHARRWWEGTLSGSNAVGLPWVCLLAFLRVTTRTGILGKPLRVEDAVGYIEAWLAQPFVEAVSPGDSHWPILRNLLRLSGTGGNLTSDAHIAAMALERGAVIYSADHDFGRFPGIEHVNPLATPLVDDGGGREPA